ncbi:MAG: helix-turn-helix transcriptional regulator [Spirochaetales bacterium]|nr:helix-turn-helix transcriptional regulator [Spirochaetales bacterium]
MENNSFGKRLTQFRKAAGLTQKELADKVGISSTLVTDYERGKLRLYDELIIKLADALNVSTDELLGIQSTEIEGFKANRRVMQRMRTIDQLPEYKKKVILKTLDDLIRANS